MRAPPTAQALLPELYAGSRDSSASSAPSTARARWCQSLAGTLAKRRCWAWKTASGVHGSQGAGSMSSRISSGAGSDDAACSPAFTPSTYAVTKARVSSPSPSNARRAVSTIRVCRAQVSQAQLRRAEHLGGGAGRAAALVLQLPGAVARGGPALPVGEVEHVGGPDVRDAVRVAVDPGHARRGYAGMWPKWPRWKSS